MVARHSFSAVVRDLHAVLPKQSANNLSVHIAFGCLLHLANEKVCLCSPSYVTQLNVNQRITLMSVPSQFGMQKNTEDDRHPGSDHPQ